MQYIDDYVDEEMLYKPVIGEWLQTLCILLSGLCSLIAVFRLQWYHELQPKDAFLIGTSFVCVFLANWERKPSNPRK